jgi:hypothetical protein
MNTKPTDMTLTASLETLVATGSHWLWKSRLRDGLQVRLPRAAALLLIVPILVVVMIALGWLLGKPWKPPMGWTAVLCPLPPLFYLGFHGVRLLSMRPGRRECLAVYDEALDLKDRLQTADEFLAAKERSSFMAAAVDDAKPAMEQAARHSLEWTWGKPCPELRRVAWMGLLGALLLVLGAFLPTGSRNSNPVEAPEAPSISSTGAPNPTSDTPATTPERPPINEPAPKPDKPEELARKSMKGKPASTKITEEPSSQLGGLEKKSTGTSEGGQTSQAASSGKASQSSGSPGSQSPSSEPEAQRTARKEETKPKKDQASEPDSKKVEDQSGATAGVGSSGESSKNPASSEWASKDRTETAENEDFGQEGDVEDEDSESEARGGLQPNLRDRRPPVNRDLGIGFGNQPNSDANGRGGPSDRKKSRGVAGLVLGVPVPDTVKGQPNPGRIKVNQERIQPQGEDMPRDEAGDRGQRDSPAGFLSERTLDESMRNIVRQYFLQNQAPETTETESPEN